MCTYNCMNTIFSIYFLIISSCFYANAWLKILNFLHKITLNVFFVFFLQPPLFCDILWRAKHPQALEEPLA